MRATQAMPAPARREPIELRGLSQPASPTLRRCGGAPCGCEQNGEEPVLRRSGEHQAPGTAPELVHAVLRSPGVPLDSRVRADLEPRFGQDFSQVRVHTDARAAASAAAVRARAYTLGQNIVFGSGAYAPDTASGRRLLAHELTHTIQQRGTAPGMALTGLQVGAVADATEQEADQVADRVLDGPADFSGVPVRSSGPAGPGVIRRQACGHDGRPPECGGYRWGLVNIETGEESSEDLDTRIVDLGLRTHFGGAWATQVQTPPNPRKAGRARGRLDGLRATVGEQLRVEVVEVKSRATEFNGGCALATREAEGYVNMLNGLGPRIVAVSRAVAAQPGLRQLSAARQHQALAAARVDLAEERDRQAWAFFRSLEQRLNQQFDQPFTSFQAVLFAGGSPGADYPAGPPVLVDCTRRGRKGVRIRRLVFQVNGAGGVSYGCTNTDCQVEEEQRQVQDQPVARPVADEERDDVTTPVLVGAGAAAAGAGAAALARRRAAQIAARRAAVELARRQAEQQALQAAWRRAAEEAAARRAERAAAARAGGRLAGRAVGRAVVIVEVASMAAGLLLVLSGNARAEAGPGRSGLEALYAVMTRNGTPPTPEMREMIENDPVLRQLAEQAAETGDASGLVRELDRQSLEFLSAHAHELTDEELNLLLSSANARAAGGRAPTSVAQLRAAIAAEQQRRRTGGTAQGTGPGGAGPAPVPAGGGAGSAGPTTGTGRTGGAAPGERTTGLSSAVRAEVAAAPAPKRRVVEALVSGQDGPRVDDDGVRRILGAVPGDITADQANRLIARVGPATGRSVDDVVASIRQAVAEVRGGAPTAEPGTEAQVTDTLREPQSREQAAAARAEYVQAMREYIQTYPSWDSVPVNGCFIRPTDRTVGMATVPLNTAFDVISVARTAGTPAPVRLAGIGRAVVLARTSRTATVQLRTAVPMVAEDGSIPITLPAGRTFRDWALVGAGRR
ncbi:DUF4157 domain-containing protein [Amycolatopsis sp. WGS_07]|uniref:eCIS core domain-containing protein n=1 Tax=Amycolatopsis sp. WGS_07 TaxID=3076764 RepID=UPI003872CBAA